MLLLPFSKRLLPVATLLAVAACEPLTCQGRVDGENAVVDDVPELPPKCAGNNVQFVGDVDITNQAQLDTLLNCNTVQGSILIHDSTDIADVGALASLTSINNGYFLAFNNAGLTTIQLPVLESLDTGFAAINNPLLTSVNLPNVETFKGDLTMRNNPLQTEIAIPKVEVLDNSDIIIEGEVKVVSFGNIILGDLPAFAAFNDGFAALTTIKGSLEVFNTGLSNFNGMQQLTTIENTGGGVQPRSFIRVDKLNPGLAIGIDFDDEFNVVPAGNANLVDFSGLGALDTVVGDIFVGFNPSLTSFTGLDDIKAVNGNFTVVENDELKNFIGFNGDDNDDNNDDGLSAINGNLFVGLYLDRFGKGIAGGNDSLVDLDGLQSLITVTGDLVLAFNGEMQTLNGLKNFTTLNGDLTFLGQNMSRLKGALKLVTIGGDLNFGQLLRVDGLPFDPNEIDDTLKLTDVFDKATAVSTEVKIDFEAGQQGFDVLTTVNGNVIVAFSDLTDLQFTDPDGDGGAIVGDDLATIGKSLILYGNSAPDSLEGIQTVSSLGGLVVNFAIDAFGDLVPFENNGFNDFAALGNRDLGLGGLKIGFDDDLDDAAFATLPNFGDIDGDVVLANVDQNQNNRGPSSLAELNVTNIGGDLVVCAIKNGDDAPIASNLDNLTELGIDTANFNVVGDVLVAFCDALTDTSMTLTSVGGTFELTDLSALETIDGLDQLGSVGELLLHDLSDVTDINIPNLTNVTGNLEIVNDPQLNSFDFNLADVGGTVRIVDLEELDDLSGLDTLDTVGGDLEVFDCNNVTDTSGLNDLNLVGGNLRLRRLNSVSNVATATGVQEFSFNQLTEVGGLEITEMGELEDLAGLQTLVRIGIDINDVAHGGGVLSIGGNAKLQTLFGLQGLTIVARKISIVNNVKLDRFAFDDDDQDRELDIDEDNDGGADEEDDDSESGLLDTLDIVGQPIRDSGILIGGQTGVIEVRNNPLLRELSGDDPERDNSDEPGLIETFVGDLAGYEGLIVLCGNEDSVDAVDEANRLTSTAQCAEAQDGIIGVQAGAGDDVDPGEGEGE